MRILTVSNLYPPNVIGGYEVLCAEVNEGLAAIGHDVTVLTSSFGGRVAEDSLVVVHQALQLLVGRTICEAFPGGPICRDAVNRANIAALLRCLDRVQPDIVFCWNLFGLDGSLLERMCVVNVPTVVMLTDNWLAAALNPGFVGDYFRLRVFAPAGDAPAPLPASTHVGRKVGVSAIFGSDYMREFYGAAAIRFESSRVIHNGVKQSPAAMVPRDRSRIGKDGTVALLFAGRVVEIKGVHVALEALGLLQAEQPEGFNFTLTIVGDGGDSAYRARLQSIAAAMGCAERVRFLDPVPQDRLFGLFQDHDSYLFPSLYEPFSLTLIHALAAGIPTVASQVGGNTEIVADGHSGVLSKRNDAGSLAEAVKRLCSDADLRQGVSEQGRAVAAHFTFDKMLRGIDAYLKSIGG